MYTWSTTDKSGKFVLSTFPQFIGRLFLCYLPIGIILGKQACAKYTLVEGRHAFGSEACKT